MWHQWLNHNFTKLRKYFFVRHFREYYMYVDAFYVPALMEKTDEYISIVAFTPYSNYQLVKKSPRLRRNRNYNLWTGTFLRATTCTTGPPQSPRVWTAPSRTPHDSNYDMARMHPGKSSRSSGYFLRTVFWILWIQTYNFFGVLFFVYFIVRMY